MRYLYRDDDITNIATSVEKIASQFKQLHNLIIEQGTILDRIDYNIQKGVENTSNGKRQLAEVMIDRCRVLINYIGK